MTPAIVGLVSRLDDSRRWSGATAPRSGRLSVVGLVVGWTIAALLADAVITHAVLAGATAWYAWCCRR